MTGPHHATSIPTVQWVCQQPATPGSFGTPAGRTLVCSCGYHTRMPALMGEHVRRANLQYMIMPLLGGEEEACAPVGIA